MKHRNQMMINLPRFALYALLTALGYYTREIPIWSGLALMLYDLYIPVTLPWFGFHEERPSLADIIAASQQQPARPLTDKEKELMN